MKHWMISIALAASTGLSASRIFAQSSLPAAAAPAAAPAAPAPEAPRSYFRLFDPSHPIVGAGFLISPKSPLKTIGVVDLAIVTHSTADGSVCDKWKLGSWCVPEAWVPFQFGVGGSLTGDAFVAPGTSANASPLLAATLLRWADKQATPILGPLKGQLEQGNIRIGGELAAAVIKGGKFQSAKEALPGRGFFDIVGNAARLDFGYAWRF